MAGSSDSDTAPRHEGTERRTRQDLRDVFEKAYQAAFPLLSSGQSSNNSGSMHFLRVVLHDALPNLQPQDIAILSPR